MKEVASPLKLPKVHEWARPRTSDGSGNHSIGPNAKISVSDDSYRVEEANEVLRDKRQASRPAGGHFRPSPLTEGVGNCPEVPEDVRQRQEAQKERYLR